MQLPPVGLTYYWHDLTYLSSGFGHCCSSRAPCAIGQLVCVIAKALLITESSAAVSLLWCTWLYVGGCQGKSQLFHKQHAM